MPSFISKEGIWEAAPERVVLPDAPKGQEIYEGPDRQALLDIAAAGGQLGTHYSLDPELVVRARQMGFKSITEYLEVFGYDPKRAAAAYEKRKQETEEHKDAPAKPPVDTGTKGGGFSNEAGVPKL